MILSLIEIRLYGCLNLAFNYNGNWVTLDPNAYYQNTATVMETLILLTTVINMIKKTIIYFSFFLFFMSCNNKNSDEKHKIISLISEHVGEIIYKGKTKSNLLTLNIKTTKLNFKKKKGIKKCKKFEDFYNKIKVEKNNTRFNISKFQSKIYKFEEIDFSNTLKFKSYIQFSDVFFNKNNTKAVVLVSIQDNHLSGAVELYFLTFFDDKWRINCVEGVSIS